MLVRIDLTNTKFCEWSKNLGNCRGRVRQLLEGFVNGFLVGMVGMVETY